MELRDYQYDIINKVYAGWRDGYKNIIIQLATGAGKTVIFSHILAQEIKPRIAIAHRIELVSQISLTLARFNIKHNIIASKSSIRNIISLHMYELKKSYYDPQSRCVVAGVDTLIKLPIAEWMQKIELVVQDEGHHPLKLNKWGKASQLFPRARGLYPTATPIRSDGYGLGRHADGVADLLIVGPSMRDLINRKFLTDYRIICPPNDLDLSQVPTSASGDYSPPKLRETMHRNVSIVGNIVQTYFKFAQGKLGVTFAVDIESAGKIAMEFKSMGIPTELITGKTDDLLRAKIMARFRNREILMLVNVDILGEGVDVPAIEVVIMARPTQSFALYSQQFGRALRPMAGKKHAIIIDHVNNWVRHGLPDIKNNWSLDRREKKSKNRIIDLQTATRVCTNVECLSTFSRLEKCCPYCSEPYIIASRSSPAEVDGDLTELAPDVLAILRGEIERIDGPARVPQHLDDIAKRGVLNKHLRKQQAQSELRESISLWAGYQKYLNKSDSEIYKLFYFTFKTDILTAQTLSAKSATELKELINNECTGLGVEMASAG